MTPVEIIPIQGSLVLRARSSELLILPSYVAELKSRTEPKEFSSYFLTNALINRPARKLFEAWLRKDRTLWKRIYNVIQNEMEIDAELTNQVNGQASVSEGKVATADVPVAEEKSDTLETEADDSETDLEESYAAEQELGEEADVTSVRKKVTKKAGAKSTESSKKKETTKKAPVKKAKTGSKAESSSTKSKKKTSTSTTKTKKKTETKAAAKKKTAKKKTTKKK